MPNYDPIRTGSVSSSSLVPDEGSQIKTDDFGISWGTIRYQAGNQSLVSAARPTQGDAYLGSLPQFSGFYVDKSGDITGGPGASAELEVTYAKQDSLFVKTPERGHDLEMRDMTSLVTTLLSGAFYIVPSIIPGQIDTLSLSLQAVPVPHPTLSYKFSSTTAVDQLGTYSTSSNLTSAPTIVPYIYKLPLKVGVHNYGIVFLPNPQGWLCLQNDVTSICGGRFFEIQQRWKMTMLFTSVGFA
jgi:hypothetical protein